MEEARSHAGLRRFGTAAARRKKRKAPSAFGSAVRRGVSAGPLTLRIPLNAAARAQLKRKHRLAVAVKVTVTTATGTAQSATGRTTLK